MLKTLLKITLIFFGLHHQRITAQDIPLKNANNSLSSSSIIQKPLSLRYENFVIGKNASVEQPSAKAPIQIDENDFLRLPQQQQQKSPSLFHQRHSNDSQMINRSTATLDQSPNYHKTKHIGETSTEKQRINYLELSEMPDRPSEPDDNNSFSLNKIFSDMFSRNIVDFLATKSITKTDPDDDDDEIPSESMADIIDQREEIPSSSSPDDVQEILKNFTLSNKQVTIPWLIPATNSTSTPNIEEAIFINNTIDDLNVGIETLVSNEEVLQINNAAESYEIDNNVKPVYPATSSIKDNLLSIIYPVNITKLFDSPIIVTDDSANQNHEDNLIAESRKHTHRYLPPNEVNIFPSREKFINIPRTETPEKQINVQILRQSSSKLPTRLYHSSKNILVPAQELDSYQEDVEKNFSIEVNKFTTEAPSRQFLKQFNSKVQANGITDKIIEPTDLTSVPSVVQKTPTDPITLHKLALTSSISKPVPLIKSHVELTTPLPSNKNRGRTFVEIQKSINVHNLLIKEENGKLLEQHEEYLKPQKYGHKVQQNYPQLKYLPPSKRPIVVADDEIVPTHQETAVTPQILNIQYPTESQRPYQYEKVIPVPYPVEKLVPVEKEVPVPFVVEKLIDRPIHVTKFVDRPYPVERVVEKQVPYPVKEIVEKLVDRPYPVNKPYPVVVPVEKIVEKQVPVNQIIEKYIDRPVPVPYPVQVNKYIPQPYPVQHFIEKIVDRPVEVEKIVEKEVQVPYPVVVKKTVEKPIEKIVDRPYPVAVPYAYETIVNRPYPVDRLVDRPVPYPVEVERIVEKIVDRPVETIVEKQVPVEVEKIVEKFVDRNVTVEKIIDRPVTVEKIVETFVDRPVPIAVPVHVPIHIPYHVPVPIAVSPTKHFAPSRPFEFISNSNPHHNHHHPHQFQFKHQNYQFPFMSGTGTSYSSPGDLYSLMVQPTPPHLNAVNFYNQPQTSTSLISAPTTTTTNTNSFGSHFFKFNNGGGIFPGHQVTRPVHHLPPSGTLISSSSHLAPIRYAKNFAYKPIIHSNIPKYDYLGPVPLENDYSQWTTIFNKVINSGNSEGGTLHKRSSDFGRNLRVEYGFKPPLVPSVEIDDQGVPLDKND